MTTIGILHPGSMGAAVAGELVRRGHTVLWCPDGRSSRSAERARAFGLEAAGLPAIVRRCDVVMALCPTEAAEPIASAVADLGFRGIYVDANAVSPERMVRLACRLETGGATVVDGSVVGSPPADNRSPVLYLSGPADAVSGVAELFTGTRVQPHSLAGPIGQASGLKLAYSAYQKASRVLAAVAHALADEYDVGPELLGIARAHKARHLAELDYTADVAAKAWRWDSELREVAEALDAADLPAGMAQGAADILSRWAPHRDVPPTPSDALRQLRSGPALGTLRADKDG